jgi:hypothetical protein
VQKYYYYKLGRQKLLPHKSIMFFNRRTTSSLGFTLEILPLAGFAKTPPTKVCCFLTYNNMGLKTLSMKCTFASLTRHNKRLSRICWLEGVKVRLNQESRLYLQKCLLIVNP